MLTFEEMDSQVTFHQQLAAAGDGQIVLLNKITVPPGRLDAAIAAWSEDAAYMQRQPGFISTQLHGGTAGSSTLVNVAAWPSAGALREAFTSPEFQGRLDRYPDGTTPSPHVFTARSRSQESAAADPRPRTRRPERRRRSSMGCRTGR